VPAVECVYETERTWVAFAPKAEVLTSLMVVAPAPPEEVAL